MIANGGNVGLAKGIMYDTHMSWLFNIKSLMNMLMQCQDTTRKQKKIFYKS